MCIERATVLRANNTHVTQSFYLCIALNSTVFEPAALTSYERLGVRLCSLNKKNYTQIHLLKFEI